MVSQTEALETASENSVDIAKSVEELKEEFKEFRKDVNNFMLSISQRITRVETIFYIIVSLITLSGAIIGIIQLFTSIPSK